MAKVFYTHEKSSATRDNDMDGVRRLQGLKSKITYMY